MGVVAVAAKNRAAHLEKSARNLPGSICLVQYLGCIDLDGDTVSAEVSENKKLVMQSNIIQSRWAQRS